MAITKRSIELEIPDPEQFEEYPGGASTIPVAYETVTGTIDVLQAMIQHWKQEDGCQRDDEKWGALMAAAGLALGSLVGAYTRRRAEHARAGRRLLDEAVAANRAINEREQR